MKVTQEQKSMIRMNELDRLTTASIEEQIDGREINKLISKALSLLSPKEEHIIIRRFGLHGSDEKTLSEIGQEFGVTADRIRQIEARAIRKLRHPFYAIPSPDGSMRKIQFLGNGNRSAFEVKCLQIYEDLVANDFYWKN